MSQLDFARLVLSEHETPRSLTIPRCVIAYGPACGVESYPEVPAMEKRVGLPGSDRRLIPGAKVVGKVDPNQRIEITIQLRRRLGADLKKTVQELAAQKPPIAST